MLNKKGQDAGTGNIARQILFWLILLLVLFMILQHFISGGSPILDNVLNIFRFGK